MYKKVQLLNQMIRENLGNSFEVESLNYLEEKL